MARSTPKASTTRNITRKSKKKPLKPTPYGRWRSNPATVMRPKVTSAITTATVKFSQCLKTKCVKSGIIMYYKQYSFPNYLHMSLSRSYYLWTYKFFLYYQKLFYTPNIVSQRKCLHAYVNSFCIRIYFINSVCFFSKSGFWYIWFLLFSEVNENL